MPARARPPILDAIQQLPDEDIVVCFVVPGRPVPKARPRFGHGGRVFTPTSTLNAERAVASAAWRAWPKHSAFSDRPCEIDATFVYAVPASWPKSRRMAALAGDVPMVAGADIDNLLKTVLDGLNGGPITDDSRVIAVSGRKAYGLTDETRVIVRLLRCACGKSASPAPDSNPKASGRHGSP
jgi:Holliday junction resolvase RusA-like endonuclease